jgi:threonine/homoserine/homoserine lactone efflux protein
MVKLKIIIVIVIVVVVITIVNIIYIIINKVLKKLLILKKYHKFDLKGQIKNCKNLGQACLIL